VPTSDDRTQTRSPSVWTKPADTILAKLRRLPEPRLSQCNSGDQPASVYAGGSTALKTISMSCSGKASLDTPIRLLAH
jgi:hypothetical protein